MMINLAAKFGKEIMDTGNFLGLGIDSSRNYCTSEDEDYHHHHHHHRTLIRVLNPIPLRLYDRPTTSYDCMELDHASLFQDSHDHHDDKKKSSRSIGGEESEDDVTMDLAAKFSKETNTITGSRSSTFLGLGIDLSSNYKILSSNRACFQDDHTNKGTIGNSGISSTTDQAGNCSTISGGKKKKSSKRKQKDIIAMEVEKGKNRKIRKIYLEPYADLSPEFLRIIGTNNPVFVYRKQLVEADVKKDQNRLLITDASRLTGLLTEEERRAVEDGEKPPGIDVIGVGCRNMGISGEYTLHVARWKTMGTVVNKEWNKMVDAKEAKAGDWVDLWGYRRDGGGFCLAVNFSQEV